MELYTDQYYCTLLQSCDFEIDELPCEKTALYFSSNNRIFKRVFCYNFFSFTVAVFFAFH